MTIGEPDTRRALESISWGDHFLRFVRADDAGGVDAVFGKVFDSLDAVCDPMGLAAGLTSEELAADREFFADRYQRGWRPAQNHSTLYPQGAFGSVHITDMHQKLSPKEFAAARACGWDLAHLVVLERREGIDPRTRGVRHAARYVMSHIERHYLHGSSGPEPPGL